MRVASSLVPHVSIVLIRLLGIVKGKPFTTALHYNTPTTGIAQVELMLAHRIGKGNVERRHTSLRSPFKQRPRSPRCHEHNFHMTRLSLFHPPSTQTCVRQVDLPPKSTLRAATRRLHTRYAHPDRRKTWYTLSFIHSLHFHLAERARLRSSDRHFFAHVSRVCAVSRTSSNTRFWARLWFR